MEDLTGVGGSEPWSSLRVAAIVPCRNEETAVGQVVDDLHAAVPGIIVYVYDNGSTDRTTDNAEAAGAEVRCEPEPGKGNVIRRALADLDADVYVMVDGDDTYDVAATPEMIQVLLSGPYDQVTGVRVAATSGAYRSGHALGNRMFNRVVSRIFGRPVNDMLSGYRVFSRRFVKSFPAVSRAFEIETELTVHAINNRVPQAEVPVGFRDRPEGSESKLRTYHDGFRILRMITRLMHHERPLAMYSTLAVLTALTAVGIAVPVIDEYLRTGLVGRFPTAILSAALVVVAFIVMVVGVLLDGLRKVRQETTRIAYMAVPAPPRVPAAPPAPAAEELVVERAAEQQPTGLPAEPGRAPQHPAPTAGRAAERV
ncbi:glycosyltransferase family 2 protein [Phycicoccus duodecadis]|uniref:Glycosyltransferase involved in cell wall biosynthesis n=1 Tax=Phycicoccus duodecadis TaxID=173053 RepID=A0A2N3YJZ2_9MICO|nr:glycosyltransferase family 2 protein [Phycicoccus duodecadis]PKW27177.1 glycosyltransferase involved in cell wall biosynthesis [Phycicoccus duodecadis]